MIIGIPPTIDPDLADFYDAFSIFVYRAMLPPFDPIDLGT
jgi:hypothetical protein